MSTEPMDDIPQEIEVKGVVGRRIRSTRWYRGGDDGFVIDVLFRFRLDDLVKAGAAKLYSVEKTKEGTDAVST